MFSGLTDKWTDKLVEKRSQAESASRRWNGGTAAWWRWWTPVVEAISALIAGRQKLVKVVLVEGSVASGTVL